MGIDVQDLVEHFKNLPKHDYTFNKNCTKIAKDVSDGNLTLNCLVDDLGPLLTDKLPAQREVGTYILTKVIQNLPVDMLSSTQLTFISSFYADRLKDHHQVIPAVIEGVLAVSKCKNLPNSSVSLLLKALFDNVPCQQQQREDRLNIFLIFENFLNNKLPEMEAMELNLVYGVISAIDGERDPQNLYHLFIWLPKFLKSIKLGQLTEEMFEIIACYFPVDFKNPFTENENGSINRNSLSAALAPCLCAIPQFDEFCIPLLLEKLSSTLVIAKLDSLELLIQSCKIFNIDIYFSHSLDICSQLINEIQNSKDPDIERTAMKALTAFINKITTNLNPDDENIEKSDGIIKDIINKVKENLRPDQILFISSANILLAICSGSKYACNKVTTFVLPLFINQFNITTTVPHQITLFNSLIDFVQVYTDLNDTENLVDVVDLADVPKLCLKATLSEDQAVRATGLQSLNLLAKMLPLEMRQCVYKSFSTLLIIPQPDVVRRNLLKCFQTLATIYPQEVSNFLLPEIFIANSVALQLYLEALTLIGLQNEFVDMVLPLLCQYCLKDLATANVAIKCLKSLLEKEHNSVILHNYLFCSQQLVQKLIDFYLNSVHDSSELLAKDFYFNILSVIALLIGFRSSDEQMLILSEELSTSKILNFNSPICIFLLSGLLLNVRKDVQIPHKRDIITQLIIAITVLNCDYAQTVIIQLVSNILNKTENEEELEELLDVVANECSPAILLNDTENCSCRLSLLCWTTKSLVLRQHSKAEFWINKMLDILSTHKSVAQGFKLIMSDENVCLGANNFCAIKLLYKQRFFSMVCDKLIHAYDLEENLHYLVAFGYLLQEAPVEIILIYFPKILKLIVLCLDFCLESDVLSTVLSKLDHLIESNQLLMGEYVQEFLPRFLNLSSFKVSMKVRIAAIQCLKSYTSGYPIYKLLPHKQIVLHTLGICLDDPKRIVRKQAVYARNCWFLLDAPA